MAGGEQARGPGKIPKEMQDVVGHESQGVVDLWASHHDGDPTALAEGTQPPAQPETKE